VLRISRSISLLIAALLLALAGYWLIAPLPDSELVEDGAGLMTEAERGFLARYHDRLLAGHDIDYRVLTARGLGDVNQAAVARFEEIAQDLRSETGRGLLLVVDAEQDLVRLEVSYALEGVFPDAFVAYVEERQMVPFFERGRVADGILATTELIVTRAQNAAANAGFESEAWIAGSGGAGATTAANLDANLGAGPAPVQPTNQAPVSPGRSPGETLAAYLTAMADRNADPNLDIYTAETRRMLSQWVVTRAQMDNLVKTYRRCQPGSLRLSPGDARAVIRYPQAARHCAPWFFERDGAAWALDLTMMQQAIRFNHDNYWRLDPSVAHPYGFAFEDWRFDRHGFPRIPK
jgi:uncharacterized protein